MPIAANSDEPGPVLDIEIEKVGFIIVKAREFDAQEDDSDPDSGSNPTDDGNADVLEGGKSDNPVHAEIAAAIRGLNIDEQVNLVALAWLGRGTYDINEWQEALDTARSEHNNRTAEYLLGMPMLGDYLEDGLAVFGESISDADETV